MPASPKITLASAADLDGDRAFWALYDASFPVAEREPPEVIVRSVAAGVAIALRARDGDATVGMATAHLLREPAAVFLVYLAVAPRARGSGLGGALLDRAFLDGAERLGAEGERAAGMVWEVDDPRLATSPVERDRRERRIDFFGRRGARVLERPYLQPPVDGVAPVPMRLMWRGGAIDEAATEALVGAIYVEKYVAWNGIARAIVDALRG